jgi:hypothetical protein
MSERAENQNRIPRYTIGVSGSSAKSSRPLRLDFNHSANSGGVVVEAAPSVLSGDAASPRWTEDPLIAIGPR